MALLGAIRALRADLRGYSRHSARGACGAETELLSRLPQPVLCDDRHCSADFCDRPTGAYRFWNHAQMDLDINQRLGSMAAIYRAGPCAWSRDNVIYHAHHPHDSARSE